MSRLGIWGTGIVVALALVCSSARAEDYFDQKGTTGSTSGGFLSRWWAALDTPPAKKQPPPKKDSDKEKDKEKDKAKAEKSKIDQPTSPMERAAAQRGREEQELIRRQRVCLKLMRIAQETNDDQLLHKAEQLDQQAQQVYEQRTAHLPISRMVFESDEQTLTNRLSAERAELAPKGPRDVLNSAGRAAGPQRNAREDAE